MPAPVTNRIRDGDLLQPRTPSRHSSRWSATQYTTPIYPDLSDSSVHVCLNTHAAVSTVALAHPGARSYTRHSAEILLENAAARCCWTIHCWILVYLIPMDLHTAMYIAVSKLYLLYCIVKYTQQTPIQEGVGKSGTCGMFEKWSRSGITECMVTPFCGYNTT